MRPRGASQPASRPLASAPPVSPFLVSPWRPVPASVDCFWQLAAARELGHALACATRRHCLSWPARAAAKGDAKLPIKSSHRLADVDNLRARARPADSHSLERARACCWRRPDTMAPGPPTRLPAPGRLARPSAARLPESSAQWRCRPGPPVRPSAGRRPGGRRRGPPTRPGHDSRLTGRARPDCVRAKPMRLVAGVPPLSKQVSKRHVDVGRRLWRAPRQPGPRLGRPPWRRHLRPDARQTSPARGSTHSKAKAVAPRRVFVGRPIGHTRPPAANQIQSCAAPFASRPGDSRPTVKVRAPPGPSRSGGCLRASA